MQVRGPSCPCGLLEIPSRCQVGVSTADSRSLSIKYGVATPQANSLHRITPARNSHLSNALTRLRKLLTWLRYPLELASIIGA
jgi:hypothetical protein